MRDKFRMVIHCGLVVTCSVVLIAAGAASASGASSKQQKDQSSFATMTPNEVLARLTTADKIKIKDPEHRLLDKWHLKWCNGGINVNAEMGRELSCALRSNFAQINTSDSSVLETSMEILFRSCGVYSSYPDNDEGVSCGMLGRLFFRIGNVPAAQAVWEHAPGCNVLDRGGHPVNGCIDAILGQSGQEGQTSDAGVDWSSGGVNYMDAYASEPQELLKLASDACSKDKDYGACQYLQSKGANIELDSVAAYNNQRIQQNGNAEAAADQVAQMNAEEHQERVNAVIGALSSLPAANDPNAIVNTANQEATQMIAGGAANDAARRQTTTQQQPQTSAQQTANSTVTPQQGAQKIISTSSSNGSAGSSQPQIPQFLFAAPVNNCVSYTVNPASAVNAQFATNTCSSEITFVWAIPNPGQQWLANQQLSLEPGQQATIPNQPVKVYVCPYPYAVARTPFAYPYNIPMYNDTQFVCWETNPAWLQAQ
jgi:hypothetical protein